MVAKQGTLDTIRTEFKQTTTATATATRTSLNKRFNEPYNGSARALYILVHYLAVLCKTSNSGFSENANSNDEFFKFLFVFERCLYIFS